MLLPNKQYEYKTLKATIVTMRNVQIMMMMMNK